MEPGRWGKTKVGVLTVIQEEFDAVRAALGADRRVRHTRYWHARGGPERFVIAKMPDRANVAASDATRDMWEHWRPDVIMVVGIAGALSSGDAGLGDVVVASYIHYGEFRKLTGTGDRLRYAAYDHPTVSLRSDITEGVQQEGRWLDRVAVERPELRTEDRNGSDPDHLKAEVGAIVAGEKVYGDPDHPEQERLLTTFEDAIAVDMESWGVGRSVHDARTDPDYNPRLAIVRGISDIVHRHRPNGDGRADDDRQPLDANSGLVPGSENVVAMSVNNDQRQRWKRYAAATAAAFASVVVEDLLDAF